ncbi:MAG: hypothetical protein J1F27_01885 [Prevotellaceae bacterium]|nr:hypothetical protein [Prevotellaceae bacterium]
MKHLLIALMLIGITLPLQAQNGLHINDIFEGNIVPKQEIQQKSLMKGNILVPYKLKVLHTVKFMADSLLQEKAEALFTKDMKECLSDDNDNLELENRDGYLYYAIVQLTNTRKGMHRYICYQCRKNADGYSLALAYMEGWATLTELRRMFKKK